MDIVYRSCCFVQAITLKTFADWQVSGRENVPPMGPLIVVSNHLSNFDSSALATSIPRRLRFLAKKEIFHWPATWFLDAYGAVPLDKKRFNLDSYKWALEKLRQDQAMVMFPEGARSHNGMRKGRPGVTHLALASQAPILPVGITGTQGLGSVLRVFNPTGKIRIQIGTPFTLPNIEGNVNKEILDSITDTIMAKVADLLPVSYQGAYQRRKWDNVDESSNDSGID